jgi:hypothetical protein
MRRSLVVAATLGTMVLASPRAQASDREEQAERLFVEGKALLNAERVSEACVAFKDSQVLDPAEGTLLALGLCHEREGADDAALDELARVIESTKASGRDDRRRVARAAIDRLHQKAARKEAVADHAPVETAEPVAAAPREDDEAPLGLRAPKSSPKSAAATPWLPIGLGGAGAVALIAGGAFGLRAFSQTAEAESRCPRDSCQDPVGLEANEAAKSAATAANVLVGAGVVLGVAAAVIFFTAGPTKKTGSRGRRVTLDLGGHGVVGTF